MPNGRFRRYYWQIRTLLGENVHLLDVDHPAHEICQEYETEYTGTFRASIVFKNRSRLVVRFSLRSDEDIEEHDYAYQYLDPQGERIFRYDDAPHYPGVSTHPHHLHRGPEPLGRGGDKVYALDVKRVDFATVFVRIVKRYLSD